MNKLEIQIVLKKLCKASTVFLSIFSNGDTQALTDDEFYRKQPLKVPGITSMTMDWIDQILFENVGLTTHHNLQ